MAIGVPLGIWAAHKPRVWHTLQPILDLMQTMPTFVYLIPILILFGLGAAPALIVTIIFAMPAPVRMTYLGITSIPKPMIEAGESFGATKRQLLWKVELPAALLATVDEWRLAKADEKNAAAVIARARASASSGSRPAWRSAIWKTIDPVSNRARSPSS